MHFNPFFSIIVPVYNIYEEALNRCINSIVQQANLDYEVIIIDDGSQRECANNIDRYQNINNIYIIHKKNEGVSSARNVGIEKARGEYILFVDGDDYLDKDCLMNVKQKIVETKADILFFKNNVFYQDANRILKNKDLLSVEKINNIASIQLDVIAPDYTQFEYNYGTPWAKAIKRSIIIENNILYEVNLPRTQDKVFMFDVLNKSNIIFKYDYSGYVYNSNQLSVCSKYNKNLWDKLFLVYNEFEKRIANKDEIYKKYLKYALINYYFETLERDIFHKDNTITYKERMILASNLFKDKIKNQLVGLDLSYFPKKRFMMLSLMKMKLNCIVYLLYYFRNR